MSIVEIKSKEPEDDRFVARLTDQTTSVSPGVIRHVMKEAVALNVPGSITANIKRVEDQTRSHNTPGVIR